MLIAGLTFLAHGGFIVSILGALTLLGAFPGIFLITNTAGQKMGHSVWFSGRRAAVEFAQQVNTAIAERM